MSSRAQSTTTTNAETQVKKKKKLRKPRYAKYVELLEGLIIFSYVNIILFMNDFYILVTDTAANERKSRVKRLKAKKLQDFIAKTQQEIIKKITNKKLKAKNKNKTVAEKSNQNDIASAAATAATLAQPIEYQKINMEALDSSLLEAGCYDDKPLIFFGKDEEIKSKQILSNPEQVQQIIKSFHNFRDIIESLEHDHIENDSYR